MDENKQEPRQAPGLTATEESGTKTAGQQVAAHLDEHKAKYIAGIVASTLIALLQAWPSICPALPGALSCAQSQVRVDAAKATIQVIKQLESEGGANE